jgi:hypothetical protein
VRTELTYQKFEVHKKAFVDKEAEQSMRKYMQALYYHHHAWCWSYELSLGERCAGAALQGRGCLI